jgi:hypothetical protein
VRLGHTNPNNDRNLLRKALAQKLTKGQEQRPFLPRKDQGGD